VVTWCLTRIPIRRVLAGPVTTEAGFVRAARRIAAFFCLFFLDGLSFLQIFLAHEASPSSPAIIIRFHSQFAKTPLLQVVDPCARRTFQAVLAPLVEAQIL